MRLGYIGLGKMGENMVKNLVDHGHEVVAHDVNEEPVQRVSDYGAEPADSPEDLVGSLEARRVVWVMVPHQVVGDVLEELSELLDEGDLVVDGGNTNYKETDDHAEMLEEHGIDFLDIGVSGGPSGARNGACMMAGGERSDFEHIEPVLEDLNVEGGYGYFGPTPSGHFVKMVHNGIEYGMMQAIAEGFDVMEESSLDLDLQEVARVYNNGAVIESSLMEWLKEGYGDHGTELEDVSGRANESGEGRWTTEAAEELGVPTDVIEDALDARLRSQESPNYQGQVITLLRHKFGGHSLDGA
jgi:6-phosphogluconate dehydrogenase